MALVERELYSTVTLPLEILDAICEQLSHSDLKALRLTSRAWQRSAEKALFDVIYLKFNGASFERLQSISDHPKFSKLVHYVHYDSRQLQHAPAFIKRSLDLSNDQYLSAYTHAANEQRLAHRVKSRLEFVEALIQFQEFQSNFLAYAAAQKFLLRDGNESKTLRGCISKLSNLLGLRHSSYEKTEPLWHLPGFEGPDPVSGSILQDLSEQTSSKAHEHFWNLFGAACSSGDTHWLRELQGSKFQLQKWNIAAAPYINSFGDLTALQELNLGLLESHDIQYDHTILAKLLKNVPSLQSLQLDFTPGYAAPRLTLADTVPSNPHWKFLGRLVLHGFETTEVYLRKFFLHHANTLHSLELGNMVFCQPDGEKAGSWISFIIFLNRSMRLKHVKFYGKLSNHVDESWFVDGHDSSDDRWYFGPDHFDCLELRIKRFITLNDPCPFEPLAEDADLGRYFNLPWMFSIDFSWKFQGLEDSNDSG
ncbi:hypothetical protein L207DRAFT_238308 [Hyaloscypha variabilis F]|uniref:F-box domain-containing protein n=1 Tax=Hyaloscypha variabilis (strain UAMH 11265 / GT02V1 / F) TaxID=1149755 RepID=A0A2J6QT22_HYAVF|nr:hypothetical protein L207DRAFT_238308 [Hyaloscypha variabilis F]